MKLLPKSVSRLQNLQTLNILDTPVHELPTEIFRLYKLRHLLVHYYNFEISSSLYSMQGVKIPDGLGCLKDLQTLTLVEANHQEVGLIKELGKLRQLRMLGISNMTAGNGRALCASIKNMDHLKLLLVSSISEDEILDLQSLSSQPQYLEQLIIRGQLEKFPNWIPELQNLVTLGLYFSGLMEDPLKCIQALPNLINLFLNQGYGGEQLHFKEDSFRKLKKLTLRNMVRLKMVKIERRALPLLEQLEIGPCLQLKYPLEYST